MTMQHGIDDRHMLGSIGRRDKRRFDADTWRFGLRTGRAPDRHCPSFDEFDGLETLTESDEVCEESDDAYFNRLFAENELAELIAEQKAELAAELAAAARRKEELREEQRRLREQYEETLYWRYDEDDRPPETYILEASDIGLPRRTTHSQHGYGPVVDIDYSDDPRDPHPLDGFLIRGGR